MALIPMQTMLTYMECVLHATVSAQAISSWGNKKEDCTRAKCSHWSYGV